MSRLAPRAVLTDIEGTTTPIAFVRDALFGFARDRLENWLVTNAHRAEVQAELAETRRLAPGRPEIETLRGWMAEDAKVTPLKTLQGLIWAAGYAQGVLRGELYPDVAPHLRRWHASEIALAVFSSGSVAAQRLLFGHSTAGDLTPLFAAFFDTRIGGKREPASYDRLAITLGIPARDILFLSDIEAELDAAATAGLQTIQLVRLDDGTVASGQHSTAADFADVARAANLPEAG